MTRQIVLNTIEKLEKIIPDDEFAYEEAIRAFLSLEKVPVLIDKVSANTSICRTRTHSKNETLFEKVSDIFIAPKIAVANYARCNKPFQPKLYGSGDRPPLSVVSLRLIC